MTLDEQRIQRSLEHVMRDLATPQMGEVNQSPLRSLSSLYIQLASRVSSPRELAENDKSDMADDHRRQEPAEIVDELHGRLFDLAWRVAETRALSLSELRAKALVLLHQFEDDRSELVSCLTRSVCEDAIRLEEAAKRGAKTAG
jgi:hypothetical protein